MATTDGVDFRIARVYGEHEIVVAVDGELDLLTAPELLKVLASAVDGDRTVIIDLGGVSFIDSEGVKVLVQAYHASRATHATRVVLRSPRPEVRKALEVTGVDKLLIIED